MKNRMKLSIGITGSSGFVGSAILKHFKDNGDNVTTLDSLVHPYIKRVKISVSGVLDWVLHFGATKSIEESFEKPIDVYRSNLYSTMASLDIAISKKARFLYMSSYVYGKPRYMPIDEKHPVFVVNPYMGSKLLGEQICFQLYQCMGISALILRGFTFYGPEQKGDQLVPSIMDSIKNHRPIIVRDPVPKRDYLHIADFIRLINLIVRSDFSGYEIYNVGGGKPYRNIDVAKIANKLARKQVPIQIEGKTRKNDVPECYADNGKITRDFRWRPEIDLLSGLSDCLSFNKNQRPQMNSLII